MHNFYSTNLKFHARVIVPILRLFVKVTNSWHQKRTLNVISREVFKLILRLTWESIQGTKITRYIANHMVKVQTFSPLIDIQNYQSGNYFVLQTSTSEFCFQQMVKTNRTVPGNYGIFIIKWKRKINICFKEGNNIKVLD